MLAPSLADVEARLPDDAMVLDVGGWGKPLARADWVIDLMPYETRGLYGYDGDGPERFRADTWVQRDICEHKPWPFEDDQFDFAVCSHTLEDIRDPVAVCSELVRVARAGYIEVPSRLEEQSWGVRGEFVGWSHHHWLVDVDPEAPSIEFVFKPGVLHGSPAMHFPPGFHATLSARERVSVLWWEDKFSFCERVMMSADELHPYLKDFVDEHLTRTGFDRRAAPSFGGRVARRARRRVASLRQRR